METTLKIKTNIQNIRLLEQNLDNISDQIRLDSSLYGVFCIVNDRIFEALCQFGDDHCVNLIFTIESNNLGCIWQIEKVLFDLIFESDFKKELDLIQHLVRDWQWSSETNQLSFCVSNLGFHYRLADERRAQLQHYLKGQKVKHIQ